MTAAPTTAALEFRGATAWRRNLRLHGWTIAVWLVLLAMVPYWRSLSEQDFKFDIQSLAIDALPLCFAAMAQAVIVISGGIDLSIGSLMGVINVLCARDGLHELPAGARLLGPARRSDDAGERFHGADHHPDADPRHRGHARDALRLAGSRTLDHGDPRRGRSARLLRPGARRRGHDRNPERGGRGLRSASARLGAAPLASPRARALRGRLEPQLRLSQRHRCRPDARRRLPVGRHLHRAGGPRALGLLGHRRPELR